MTLGNDNGTDGQTDGQTDRRTDKSATQYAAPPREEGRIIMEGQRHNNPLNRVAFVYNGPKGMELVSNPCYIVEAAKALVSSFKLVTPAPKSVREMTQLPRKT